MVILVEAAAADVILVFIGGVAVLVDPTQVYPQPCLEAFLSYSGVSACMRGESL